MAKFFNYHRQFWYIEHEKNPKVTLDTLANMTVEKYGLKRKPSKSVVLRALHSKEKYINMITEELRRQRNNNTKEALLKAETDQMKSLEVASNAFNKMAAAIKIRIELENYSLQNIYNIDETTFKFNGHLMSMAVLTNGSGDTKFGPFFVADSSRRPYFLTEFTKRKIWSFYFHPPDVLMATYLPLCEKFMTKMNTVRRCSAFDLHGVPSSERPKKQSNGCDDDDGDIHFEEVISCDGNGFFKLLGGLFP